MKILICELHKKLLCWGFEGWIFLLRFFAFYLLFLIIPRELTENCIDLYRGGGFAEKTSAVIKLKSI